MRPMFEESTDAFMARWRNHAASVRIFSRTEGTPLLECEAGGAILQMLERTGPYLAPPGDARVIINPTAAEISLHGGGMKRLEANVIGDVRGCGEVVVRDDPFLVLDTGVPIVLGVQAPLKDEVRQGTMVSFDAVPPIHAFVLPKPKAQLLSGPDGEAP